MLHYNSLPLLCLSFISSFQIRLCKLLTSLHEIICISLIALSLGNYPKPFHITYIRSRFAPAYPHRAYTWHWTPYLSHEDPSFHQYSPDTSRQAPTCTHRRWPRYCQATQLQLPRALLLLSHWFNIPFRIFPFRMFLIRIFCVYFLSVCFLSV